MSQAKQLVTRQQWSHKSSKREFTIDAPCLVVAVPRPAVALPDRVLDPLLRMLVKAICDILAWDPGLDVVTLHLLDDLNSVLADAEQGPSNRTVLDRPILGYSLFSGVEETLLTMWVQQTLSSLAYLDNQDQGTIRAPFSTFRINPHRSCQ